MLKLAFYGDDFTGSTDAMEAQAFAFLAVRSLLGLPLSYPATTGVPKPMTGGVKADYLAS